MSIKPQDASTNKSTESHFSLLSVSSLLGKTLLGLLGIALALILCLAIAIAAVLPTLPSIEAVTDYRPKIPLRIYTADGALIGEFGEERRTFVKINDIPDRMKKALLSIEDDRFYAHSGIDLVGIIRATLSHVSGGGGGASTITQQVARNFFLTSNEPSFTQKLRRKFYEILLSLKIEASLSKDQILEVYMNHIYLGERAYGFAAAANTYFGKTLNDLTVAEAAMLAGLPKAPAANNPIVNPKRARSRQLYILERMRILGYINEGAYDAAKKEEIKIRNSRLNSDIHAEYVAEMARQLVFDQYKEDAYTLGLSVTTTLLKEDQQTAYESLRKSVLDYERRHGYRGPEAYIELPDNPEERDEAIGNALLENPSSDQLISAVVLEASPKQVKVQLRNSDVVTILGEGLRFAAPSLAASAPSTRAIRRGAVIRILKDSKGNWEIVQMPEVEAAFVAVNPNNGAVRALVGGFDFNRNKFNHVTQAQRQPGSSFKPFIYSSSLEKGFTPSTLINDAPIFIDSSTTGGQAWAPKNYDGKFDGPMRMRQALARSKNMVSIRLMQAVGPKYTQEWITRFGFEAEKHPPYLTIALGAGSVTPWQMADAYSVFANGGFKINPFIIFKVTDQQGNVVMQAKPKQAGDETNRAIDARNAYSIWSMMQDVIRAGTATKALVLKRPDLAGKTGTTNDAFDAWFAGYNNQIVGISWVGYDQPRSLGERETGGGVALPMWISYMAKVLPKMPEVERPFPEGLAKIGGEIFYVENIPGQGVSSLGLGEGTQAEDNKKEEAKEQLF
ncbi:MAG: penicillin-binding protein 1A [Burkholderiaceae bacterium]|nr:penicillin-binding protein 1A [Burkholderiaceae bacterium]